MNKLKAGLAATAGLVVGIVTLRSVRQRRTNPRAEAKTAAEDALGEARVAVDHAGSAVEHARVAGEKTVEYVDEELEARNDGDVTRAESTGRLRKVGKGWVRR